MRLNKKLTVDQANQLEQMVFVGRLATKEELSLTFIDSAISFSDTSHRITFYIKCLSEVPESIEEHFEYRNKIFTANTNSGANRALLAREGVDFDRLNHIELRDQVPNLFENKLIVFRLVPQETIVFADIELLEDEKSLDKYFTLPGPKLRASETKRDLEEKLVQEHRPIILNYYPDVLQPTPELIIYEDTVYHVDLENKSNPTTYFQRELSDVKYIELSEEDLDYYLDIIYSDDLIYISSDKYLELKDEIQDKGKLLSEKLDDDEAKIITVEQPSQTEMKNKEEIVEEEGEDLKEKQKVMRSSELQFIEKFIHIARFKYRLFHEEEDLINFHTSIKTNTITILGGMSGTGKTQLARAYAEALELPEENLAFVPISPSYQEPGDVLGYLNPQTGVYYESETGLVNLLLRAEQDQNNLYMVIFDEMNLSQVEHWFSPFLSLLELKSNRKLHLFNDNNRVINGNYKPEVRLHDNIIFVGTVNFDETTRSFSDRLLDRVNIIEPRKAKFEDTIDFYKSLDSNVENDFNDVPISREVMRKRWLEHPEVGLHLLTKEEVETLDRVHNIINASDPQKGVSFRVALAITKFIVNLPEEEDGVIIERGKAFDYQLNQRILTKINGIDSFVEPLVGYYNGTEYIDGEITKILRSESAQKASNFTMSLQTLQNKAKELNIYGFAN